MSQKTSIEWARNEDGTAGMTWNAVRGCTKISPGCKHCYAETFAERWRGIPGHPYEQGFDLRLVPEKLAEPLRRRKPTTYFVNSMSDLFHDDVTSEYVAKVWSTMECAAWHTFQVLTKRAERMKRLMRRFDNVLPNVWLGVSVEDRKYGLPRIDELRATPAAVRFLSCEPLLEDLGTLNLTDIDWVIVGGESGHGARPMEPEWARSIRDQCVAASVPFLFKQWGAWCHPDQLPDATVRDLDAADPANLHGDQPLRVGKKAAGREIDGRTWDEMPHR